MLMLGRETNQPADLMFGEGQEKIYSGNDEYVMGLENAIKNAHEVARKTIYGVNLSNTIPGPFHGGLSFLHFPLILAVSKTYTRPPFLYCFSSIFTS
jgi:hypothetical protein